MGPNHGQLEAATVSSINYPWQKCQHVASCEIKGCTNHGKDSSPPPFVQSVGPGCRWDLIATVSSWLLAGGPTFSLYVRHGQQCTYLEVSLARSIAYISQQQHSTAHGQ